MYFKHFLPADNPANDDGNVFIGGDGEEPDRKRFKDGGLDQWDDS